MLIRRQREPFSASGFQTQTKLGKQRIFAKFSQIEKEITEKGFRHFKSLPSEFGT